MKKGLSILVIATVLGAGVWLFLLLFPSDEKLVRRVLVDAARAASIEPNESPLVKLAGANKLAGCCSQDVVLKLDAPGSEIHEIHGRDELVQAAAAMRAGLQQARIELYEIHVSIGPDKQSATGQVVASVYLNGGTDPMVQEFKLTLGKIDSHWKITRVETVKNLGM